MKKLKYCIFAGILALTACGPSAEEQAREQQRVADSAAQAAAAEMQMRMQDSIAQIEKMKQDSLSMIIQRTQDSLRIVAVQDSINRAANKASTPKKKQPVKQDEAPKTAQPGQGRG